MTSSQTSSAPLSSGSPVDILPEGVTPEQAEDLLRRLKAELSNRESRDRLALYRPYPKQIEFHNLTGDAKVKERLFMAGNQLGKTLAGAAEDAIHLTGRYPDWWKGHRFSGPITMIVGSESSELTRDGLQRLLIGPPADESAWGTGFIPADAILDRSRKMGTPNAIDSVTVRHKDGGASTLLFKSYDQGRGKWQANTVHYVHFDEEPPFDVYSEGRTRTTATQGLVTVTFTPLKGISQVVKRFLNDPSPSRKVVVMTINDVQHISEADRERIIKDYPEHEREARANGTPTLGAGAVYPVTDTSIVVSPIPIPQWWKRIAGLDFGWDHPTAAVELAYDPDHDVIYVVREHRAKQKTPPEHAITLRTWGSDLRFAWPHDGLQSDKGSGEELATQYRKTGLKLLAERSTFPDGGNSVEAGIMAILTRMQSGRWKVFSTCTAWLEEKRLYHREEKNDGGSKLVKTDDDLLDASRYAMMSLRFARVSDRRSAFGVRMDNTVSETAIGTGEVDW